MTWIDLGRSAPAAEAIGWALVHFMWQGAAIALIAAVVLRLLRRRDPNVRYVVACMAMLAMIAAPMITLIIAWPSAAGTGPSPAVAATSFEPSFAESWLSAPLRVALTIGWLIGVLLLQTRLVLLWSNAQHLKRSGVRAASRQWDAVVDTLCDQLGVRVRVALVESSIASVPMLIGWLRPVILVPTFALTGLSPDQLRAIIAHELSHVRRHDYLVNLVQAVCETLLFYHPAVWWLSGRIRVEREYCCDDLAVRVCGDALCYVKALSALEEMRCDAPCQPVLASTGGSLMDRIGRIAGMTTERRAGGWLAPLAIAGALTVSVTVMVFGATVEAETSWTEPIDHVNVVDIVRTYDPEQAEMLSVLADAGVANSALVVVMQELGVDRRAVAEIERAVHREAYVEEQLSAPRAAIADAMAEGRLSTDDAARKLEHLRHEYRTQFEMHHGMSSEEVRERIERHVAERLLERRAKIAEKVEAGIITEIEAERYLAESAAKLRAEAAEKASRAVADPEGTRRLITEHLRTLKARLTEGVAAGTYTEADAAVRLDRAREQAHAWMSGHGEFQAVPDGAHEELAAMNHDHLERLHEALKKEVEAGTITHELAVEKFHAAMAESHRRSAREAAAKAEYQAAREKELAAGRDHDGKNTWVERRAIDEAELAEIRAKLAAAVGAGVMTEQDARAKLEALMSKARSTMTPGAKSKVKEARAPRLTESDRASIRAGLMTARARLQASIAAGDLTEEQIRLRQQRIEMLMRSLSAEPSEAAATAR